MKFLYCQIEKNGEKYEKVHDTQLFNDKLLENYSRNQRDTVVLFPLRNYTQQQQQAT